jgi:hypothetical protein
MADGNRHADRLHIRSLRLARELVDPSIRRISTLAISELDTTAERAAVFQRWTLSAPPKDGAEAEDDRALAMR